jgi:hypothetical protein
MKKSSVILIVSLALAYSASATPVLSIGTPNLASLITGSHTYSLNPRFGVWINFDDLAGNITSSTNIGPYGYPVYALPAAQYASQGVASLSDPNGLYATLLSPQSPPVYLTTLNGSTDTTITLTNPTGIIGIGLAGDGSTPVTLDALGANNSLLASFSGIVPDSVNNPDKGYYLITDTTNDIASVVIMSNQSLGIDDLQFAPEPGSLVLMGAGLGLLALSRLRKRAS